MALQGSCRMHKERAISVALCAHAWRWPAMAQNDDGGIRHNLPTTGRLLKELLILRSWALCCYNPSDCPSLL